VCVVLCSTFVPDRRWLATHVDGHGTAGRGVERSPCCRLWVDGVWAAREAMTKAPKPPNPSPENPVSLKNRCSSTISYCGPRPFQTNVRKFSKKKCPLAVRPQLHVWTGDGCQACLAAFKTCTHLNYTGRTGGTPGIYCTAMVSCTTPGAEAGKTVIHSCRRGLVFVECRPVLTF